MWKKRLAVLAVATAVTGSLASQTRAQDPAVVSGGKCSSTQKTIPEVGLKLCTDPASCKTFCQCQCTFDPHKWQNGERNDHSTTCPGMVETGPGMLPVHGTGLVSVKGLSHLKLPANLEATQPAVDGLTKLDAIVAAPGWNPRYRVEIMSCHRTHVEDSEIECGYVLKAQHVFKKYTTVPVATQADKNSLAWANRAQDPMKLGLSYPGATPHSAGNACDIRIVDTKTGDPMFSFVAKDTPAVKAASRALDEAITKTGGKRLSYEAWHFEWGGTSRSRCTYPDCDAFWPPKGSP